MSLLESVLSFLTNQAAQFTSCGIGCSYFSWNFPLSLLLWYDFKILVKSMAGGTFLSLASTGNVQQQSFKYAVFYFLDLEGAILNLIWLKINKKCQNFHHFSKFCLVFFQKSVGNMINHYKC